MNLERLDANAIQRVSGPSWASLREPFFVMSDVLLNVSKEAVAILTTIYVKYQVTSQPTSDVFAVAWLKSSKNIVLGLALPDDADDPMLGSPPKGMTYKGITKYLVIGPGEPIPEQLENWAITAYNHTQTRLQL